MIARFLQQRLFRVPVSRSGVRSRLLPPIKQATESRVALILSSGVVIGPPFFTLNALRTVGPTVLFIKIFKRTREALIIFNDACSIGLMNHVWLRHCLHNHFMLCYMTSWCTTDWHVPNKIPKWRFSLQSFIHMWMPLILKKVPDQQFSYIKFIKL